VLTAQPTRQSPLPLAAISPGVFACAEAGLRFQFAPDKPTFALLENDKTYIFTKD
jgi:hypothetical protein